MNIELNLNKKKEEYTFQSGDIVKDIDGDLYLIVDNGLGKYNLLGLTYNKGGLMYLNGIDKDRLGEKDSPLVLIEKSENVTIEIKTKGE